MDSINEFYIWRPGIKFELLNLRYLNPRVRYFFFLIPVYLFKKYSLNLLHLRHFNRPGSQITTSINTRNGEKNVEQGKEEVLKGGIKWCKREVFLTSVGKVWHRDHWLSPKFTRGKTFDVNVKLYTIWTRSKVGSLLRDHHVQLNWVFPPLTFTVRHFWIKLPTILITYLQTKISVSHLR